MGSNTPSDSAELQDARLIIGYYVSKWIQEANVLGTIHKRRRHFFPDFLHPLPHEGRFLVYTIR